MAGELELRYVGPLIVRRMSEAVDDIAGAFARRLTGGAGELTRSAGHARHTDGEARDILEGTVLESPGVRMSGDRIVALRGTDVYGAPIEVDPKRIAYEPLRDSDGEYVGISFPTSAASARAAGDWAAGRMLGIETAGVVKLPGAVVDRAGTGLPHEPGAALPRAVEVRRTSDLRTPFVVMGRFDNDGAVVMVRNTPGDGRPEVEPVHLPAEYVGRVIRDNTVYAMKSLDEPRRPVALVSQNDSPVDGSVSKAIAEQLHESAARPTYPFDRVPGEQGTVTGVVHPTRTIGPLWPESTLEARGSVTADGRLTSEYAVHEPPSG